MKQQSDTNGHTVPSIPVSDAADGVFVLEFRARWVCVWVDEGYRRLFDRDADQMSTLLQRRSGVPLPDDMTRTLTALADPAAVSSGRRIFFDHTMPDEDGNLRHTWHVLRPLAEHEGVVRILGQVFDVTELVGKQEQALAVREQETFAALKHSGKRVYRYLLDGRRAVLPEEVSRAFNLPARIDDWPAWAAARGKIVPESLQAWFGLFEAIHRGEQNGTADIFFRGKTEAEPRLYRLQFTSFADSRGLPASALISFEDVSQGYQEQRMRAVELDAMIRATHKIFSEILTVNLTRDRYRLVRSDALISRDTPSEGCFDAMLDSRILRVVPQDRKVFRETFSCAALLEALDREGRDGVTLTYRRVDDKGAWYWYETVVVRQTNPYDEDVLCVGMSRNIDEQKAEEERLRRELHLQAEEMQLQSEELRLTMDRMGKTLNYYDIPTRTLTMSPAFAEPRGLPHKLFGYPESLFESSPETFSSETRQTLCDMYAAIRQGAPSGSREVSVIDRDGRERRERLTFATIFDASGTAQRAVISVEDITDVYSHSRENRRLRENEQVLRIAARHSNRTICYYDLKTGLSRRWSESMCAACPLPPLCKSTYPEILQSGGVFEDSVGELEEMFHRIHNGVAGGEHKICFKDAATGAPRWFDLKYSTIRNDGEDHPTVALISFVDITEQHERELAYQRHLQELKANKDKELLFLESDLISDIIEQQGGGLLSDLHIVGMSQSAFLEEVLKLYFTEENRNEAKRFLSPGHLLARHAGGNHRLEETWLIRSSKGEDLWLKATVDMVADPYSHHIKAFFRFEDITLRKQEDLAVQRRAEQDGMTGLLNRVTCEERIQILLHTGADPGGVLVLLDLDDLKGINDNLGHEHGDKAIIGIAQTLKTHFRKDDVIGRLGGDEFLVFLPGSAGREEAIGHSMTALLHKLAAITVGPNNERTISCSIGCASERLGRDSFAELYRRADLALYSVKRKGKAAAAFYTPQLEGNSCTAR